MKKEQFSLFPPREEGETVTRPEMPSEEKAGGMVATREVGETCPNCGGGLQGRKCKLFCLRPGCGYLVTCSEW